MQTVTAGTLESMDCMVTVTKTPAGSGIAIHLSGSSVARFAGAMEKKIRSILKEKAIQDLEISVQDNGALDNVLGARVETALRRLEEAHQ